MMCNSLTASSVLPKCRHFMNHAPQLSPVSDAAILAGRTLLVTNLAADADLGPPRPLRSACPNPAGGGDGTIPASGLITWRPSEIAFAQSGATYPLATVQVADNGAPSLTATQSFCRYGVVTGPAGLAGSDPRRWLV